MLQVILHIYDRFRRHPRWAALSLVVLTLAAVAAVTRIHFKEDIADFLPLDPAHRNALQVYQDISGANRIIAVFSYRDSTRADADEMVAAIDDFTARVSEADTLGMASDVTSRIDMERLSELTAFVYAHIPYFLTEADYTRIDSLLDTPGYVRSRLEADKQMLLFPTGGMLQSNIGRDPLNLFTPVVEQLGRTAASLQYELYDGCIFSPDMTRAVVMVNSRYGSSESEQNARLVSLLDTCAASTARAHDNVDVHLVGGPVIAVGNSSQIKTDSLVSVALSTGLILLLLYGSLRNWRNLLLIALSIAWGWLFALGGLSLVHGDVSMIVVGISSVILGIAVNYPLHYIAHLGHTPHRRRALREIAAPLVVGNVTTVGAFLALVPLRSVAMRDLGLFASFLLVGTILFVLLYLPHAAAVREAAPPRFLDRLSRFAPENRPWMVGIVAALTVVLAFFSLRTGFDTDISHINYMDARQRADLEYFQRMMTAQGTDEKVYALVSDTTLDAALARSRRLQPAIDGLEKRGWISRQTGCGQFVTDSAEQARRIGRWRQFTARRADAIRQSLAEAAAAEGFAPGSFDEFLTLLTSPCEAKDPAWLEPLIRASFASNVSRDSLQGRYNVVSVLSTPPERVRAVEEELDRAGGYGFDVRGMNSAIAKSLSDDFNYIGWACGCIVFVFLWLSMGSLELALLSFVPMAVSWVWILGIMGLFGVDFNIVNIILATFIFGQGDDYTIFMTEGACYEYAYRRRMLSSYKAGILLSALIMFIGIGSLVLARHPALFSLAEVTVAGMFSVVLMAYLFPPLIFRLLVRKGGAYRTRPLTLPRLLRMAVCAVAYFLEMAVGYAAGFVCFEVLRPTAARRRRFRRFTHRVYAAHLRLVPGCRWELRNEGGETFSRPAIVVCNHQSMLDSALLLALSDRLLFVSNRKVGRHHVVGLMLKWLGHITLSDDGDNISDLGPFRRALDEGYSIVMFAEGQRNGASSILRFHKGAFYLAERLGVDMVPVMLHGLNHILPRNSLMVFPGRGTVVVKPRISPSDEGWGADYTERTKRVHAYFVSEYARLKAEIETPAYLAPLVTDRYRYKGADICRTVRQSLRRCVAHGALESLPARAARFIVTGGDYGAAALLLALWRTEAQVTCVCPDEDHRLVALYSAEGVAPNLRVVTEAEAQAGTADADTAAHVVLVSPTEGERAAWKGCSLTEIK